jgi:sodium transport system permease protein
VAFRGFILSGLQRDFSIRSAIVLSAFLFGFLHVLLSLFQQLFNATLLGIVLGLLAVRSRSLLPGIVFHLINNGGALVASRLVERGGSGTKAARWLYRDPDQLLYHWPWVVAGALASVLMLTALVRDGRPASVKASGAPDPLAHPG